MSVLTRLSLVSATVAVLGFGFAPLPPGYEAGSTARDFSLRNVDGKMVSLASFTDAKGFIVVFTCNHCPFAKMYEDRVIALDKKFAAKGFPVIAISSNDVSTVPDDSPELMASRAKEKHYSFPYLFDESQEIAKTYGATNTPHVYILNKEKNGLVVRYVGAIDDNAQDATAATKFYVEDAVNALLSGGNVALSHTKAVGCSIKWKKQG